MVSSIRLTAAAGCAGALAVLASSCGRPTKAEATSKPIQNPIAVAVAKVSTGDLVRTLELAAEFRPYQEVEVHAKVAGFVKHIYVDVGDRVNQGQVLAILEVPELADELSQAMAAVKRSESDVQRAKGDLQRAEDAHTLSHLSFTRLAKVVKVRPNLVAQQDIDEAEARDRESEAQIDSAKAALAAAEEQVGIAKANAQKVQVMLDYTRITAPFTGVITRRFADTGAMVQAGTASQSQAMPVVRLSENQRLRLVLPVPEEAVPNVHLGAPVKVRVTALNRTFEGRVARFADKVDLSTRTMWTEVDVMNPQWVLMPGMYAYADFAVERRDNVLTVPVQAVEGQGGSATVLVVNSSQRIERRTIKLGMETSTRDEVAAGLRAGELVVIGSRNRLRPGTPVSPMPIGAAELGQGDSN